MAAKSQLYLGASRSERALLPAHHLVTHGVVVGMTGSGKTGLVTVLVEEALRARVPVLAIDVKGDFPQITKLRVESHTDDDGDEVHNQQLSADRAREVVRWLTEHEVEPHRLTAVGCGSRDPVEPNTTAANKRRNRRMELDIVDYQGTRFELHTEPCAPNPYRKK